MAIEAYSPEWEEQEYQRLAPRIEQIVNRLFANRGAKFGAKDDILAKRLAALRSEIAIDSATKRSGLDERKRQENRSLDIERERRSFQQGEQLRREGEARNERARQELIQERRNRDLQDAQTKDREGQLRSYFFDPNAADYGQSNYLKYQDYLGGKVPSTQTVPDPYGKVRKDWEDRIHEKDLSFGPTLPADQEIGRQIGSDSTIRNRGFYPSYTQALSFSKPETAGASNATNSRGFYDYNPGPEIPTRNEGFSTPGGYGGYAAVADRWSGDIGPQTPNEFRKFGRGVKNTASDIYGGFKSAFSF
jgi:hypothetical protein